MTDFPWDNADLEKLLGYFDGYKEDITTKKIMDKNRFPKAGRRKAEARDFRHLMQMAVKHKKVRVTKGFLIGEDTYAIRLVSEDFPFIDPLFTHDFIRLICEQCPKRGWFSFLSSKVDLIDKFPSLKTWDKKHCKVWKIDHVYWRCMRSALFNYKYLGGDIGEIPRCIDKKEFTLRFHWIICQCKALEIYQQYRPKKTAFEYFEYFDSSGETVRYTWSTREELLAMLIIAHADTTFALTFLEAGDKELSPTRRAKYIDDVRKCQKDGIGVYKNTPDSKNYRRATGDDLWDYKTEESVLHWFSSGTWFRNDLEKIDDPAIAEALAEWTAAEDRSQIHKIRQLRQQETFIIRPNQ